MDIKVFGLGENRQRTEGENSKTTIQKENVKYLQKVGGTISNFITEPKQINLKGYLTQINLYRRKAGITIPEIAEAIGKAKNTVLVVFKNLEKIKAIEISEIKLFKHKSRKYLQRNINYSQCKYILTEEAEILLNFEKNKDVWFDFENLAEAIKKINIK